jgi:hypothetical protein
MYDYILGFIIVPMYNMIDIWKNIFVKIHIVGYNKFISHVFHSIKRFSS